MKKYMIFLSKENSKKQSHRKKIADSMYGKNYWTPQLLYIEAVYYIKQREDSTAKSVLNNIISQFHRNSFCNKATNHDGCAGPPHTD